MGTEVYKENFVKIPKTFWIILIVLLVVINATSIYIYYRTYSESEDASKIGLSNQNLDTGETGVLPGEFDDTNRPTKAFVANETYRDIVSGVTIKYPAQWQISSTGNLILIKKDACGSSGAIYYPALYRSTDITPKVLSETFINLLKKLPAVKNKLQFGQFFLSETSAINLVSGQMCSKDISGQIESIIEGDLAQVRFFWGPKEEFDNLRLAWNDVYLSFSANSSGQFLEIQGEEFEAGLADGWSLTEKKDGLDLTGKDKMVTFRVINSEDSLSVIADNFIKKISKDDEDEGDIDKEELFEISERDIISERTFESNINNIKQEIYLSIFDFVSEIKKMRAQITAIRPKGTQDIIISMRQSLESEWVKSTPELMSIEKSLRIKPNKDNQLKIISLPFVSSISGSSFIENYLSELEFILLEEDIKFESMILGYVRVKSNILNKEFWAPISQRQPDGNFLRTLSDGTEEELQVIQ